MAVDAAAAETVAEVRGASTVHYGPLSDEVGPPTVLAHAPSAGGRAVAFMIPVGARYLEFGIRDFRGLVAAALAWTASSPPPVRVFNAGDALALTAFRQGKRLLLHLVNSVRDETSLPINETISSFNVALEVDLDSPPQSVVALADETGLSWQYDDGLLRAHLDEVAYHVLLVIE